MTGLPRPRCTLGAPQTVAFGAAERDLLLRLLQLPTAGPLETRPLEHSPGPDQPICLWQAQNAYAEAARPLGFEVVHHAAAEPEALTGPDVPLVLRQAMEQIPEFLASQPSLVLRLGGDRPRAGTVMFNVHLDTVAGFETPYCDGARFYGRGAIDAKGPAVALLAGVRAAVAANPTLGRDVTVLIQVVAGEEGGAMGYFGTRPLVRQGYVGRLNVFCEPTGRQVLPRATAAMTACLRVDGEDAIDDQPGAGHNATVLLGFLAQHLAATVPGQVAGGSVCVAGLQTGALHNKVYGSGRLLLNLAYATSQAARQLEAVLNTTLADGLASFAQRYSPIPEFGRTAAEAAAITSLEWHKRGLPALANTDPWAESLLAEAKLAWWPADKAAFTCDAIWLQGLPETYTVVYGPGDLGANNAHAAGEYADLAELERYAADIARVLACFSAQATNAATTTLRSKS